MVRAVDIIVEEWIENRHRTGLLWLFVVSIRRKLSMTKEQRVIGLGRTNNLKLETSLVCIKNALWWLNPCLQTPARAFLRDLQAGR
ncbi:hypothetical protein U9M48_005798 [Paspalum notatum var. saurae]